MLLVTWSGYCPSRDTESLSGDRTIPGIDVGGRRESKVFLLYTWSRHCPNRDTGFSSGDRTTPGIGVGERQESKVHQLWYTWSQHCPSRGRGFSSGDRTTRHTVAFERPESRAPLSRVQSRVQAGVSSMVYSLCSLATYRLLT